MKIMKEIKEKVLALIKDYTKSIMRACLTFNRTSNPEDAMRGHQYRLVLFAGVILVATGTCSLVLWNEWRMFLLSIASFVAALGWCIKMEYDYCNDGFRFGYFLCVDVKEGALNDRYRFVGLPGTEFEKIAFFLTRKKKERFDIDGVYFMCFGKESEQSGFNDETLKMNPLLTEIGGSSNE